MIALFCLCVPKPSSVLIARPNRLNVSGDDRALLAPPGPVRLTVQVNERTCGRDRCAPTSIDCAAAEGARSRSTHEWGSLVLGHAISMVSIGPQAITIIRPETLVRWHRAGFRRYWWWKSRSLGGRPKIDGELRALIRRMSAENPLWGAPRIHGELLKLGFELAQSSVAKYIVKRCGPPSQGWRTFLRNHAPDIAAMDLFVTPTIGFDVLYTFIIVRLARRNLVWINVPPYPTAELVARQITEAFPWNEAPRHLIRDRDQVYGAAATRRLRAMV